MGTQTSRATYSRLLVNSFIFGYSFHSVNLILQAVHPLITFDGGGGKAVVLPPCLQFGEVNKKRPRCWRTESVS